ncbi:MAG: cysteine peptidase family C39 domain-containing protein, partial [Candidatus Omnitrophota bacterium]
FERNGTIYIEVMDGSRRTRLIEITKGHVKIWSFSYDQAGGLVATVWTEYDALNADGTRITAQEISGLFDTEKNSIDTSRMLFRGYELKRKITRGDVTTWTTKGMSIEWTPHTTASGERKYNISKMTRNYIEYEATRASAEDIANNRVVWTEGSGDTAIKYSQIKYSTYTKITDISWGQINNEYKVNGFKTTEEWTNYSDSWEKEDMNSVHTPAATGDDTWVHKQTLTTGRKTRDIQYEQKGNEFVVSRYINNSESWKEDVWTDASGTEVRRQTPWSRSTIDITYRDGTPRNMTYRREAFIYDDLHKDGFWTVLHKESDWDATADNGKGKWRDIVSYSLATTDGVNWYNYNPSAVSASNLFEYVAMLVGGNILSASTLSEFSSAINSIQSGVTSASIYSSLSGLISALQALGINIIVGDFDNFATSKMSFRDYLTILIGKKKMTAAGLNQDSFNNFGTNPSIMDILTGIIGKDNAQGLEALTNIVLAGLGLTPANLSITNIQGALDFIRSLDNPALIKELSNRIWDRLTSIQDILSQPGIGLTRDNLLDRFFASGQDNLWNFFVSFYSGSTGNTLLESRGITSESLNSIFTGEVLYAFLKAKITNNPALFNTFGLTPAEFLARLGLTPSSLSGWTGGNFLDFISKKASIGGIFSLYNPAVHGTLWNFLTQDLKISASRLNAIGLRDDNVNPEYSKYYDQNGVPITPWAYLASIMNADVRARLGITDNLMNYINDFANREIRARWGYSYNIGTGTFGLGLGALPATAQFNFNVPNIQASGNHSPTIYRPVPSAPGTLWAGARAGVREILDNIKSLLTRLMNASPEERQAILNNLGLGHLTIKEGIDFTRIIGLLGQLSENAINCAVEALYNLLGGRVGRAQLAEMAILVDILTGTLTPEALSQAVSSGQLFLSMYSIAETARMKGVNLAGYQVADIRAFTGNNLNIIAHIRVGGSNTGNHFVVIRAITNTHVTYVDGEGEHTESIEDFNAKFTGSVLLPDNRAPPVNATRLSNADLQTKLGGINSLGALTGLNPGLTYANITAAYLNNQLSSLTFNTAGIIDGNWLFTYLYSIEFTRDNRGRITGQKTTVYENIPSLGLIKTSLEVSEFIWKNGKVGGVVTGSVITTYEYIPGQEAPVLSGIRKTENMYNPQDGRYMQVTYYNYAGYLEYDSSKPFNINDPLLKDLIIPVARQEIFTRAVKPSDVTLPGYIGGKYQEIRIYDYMGTPFNPLTDTMTSRQYIWNSFEDVNKDNRKEKITNTFNIDPFIKEILTFEKSWKEIQKIDGIDRYVTITQVHETKDFILTSVRVSYKGEFKDVDNVTRFGTVTKIWEAGFDITKDQPTSTVYNYKVKDGDKLVTYTDTFIGTVFDTRQKTYYAKQLTLQGEKMVQVTENWIGKDFLDSFSFTYWGKVTDSLAKDSQGNPIEKTVKITENYLDLNRNNIIDNDPTKADSDTSVIESRYYAYYITGGKLVLERFEGTKDSLFRVSVEERSTVIYNNRAAQKTEYKDPEGAITISTTYTWKEVLRVNINGRETNLVFTITDTYAQDTDLLLTKEFTRRMLTEEANYPRGAIGAVTITETHEAGMKTSVRMTYRIQGAPSEVSSSLAANEKTIITVTKVWEGDVNKDVSLVLRDEPTSINYTYKIIEGEGTNRKLVTYTDTFIGTVFDTRQ